MSSNQPVHYHLTRKVLVLLFFLAVAFIIAGVIYWATIEPDLEALDYFAFGVGKTLIIIGAFFFLVGAILLVRFLKAMIPGSLEEKSWENLRFAIGGQIFFGILSIIFESLIIANDPVDNPETNAQVPLRLALRIQWDWRLLLLRL